MVTRIAGHIQAGSIDELKDAGCRVITGGGHAIAVIYHHGQVYAVDNRCPTWDSPWIAAASVTAF